MEINLTDGQWAILEPISARYCDGKTDVSIRWCSNQEVMNGNLTLIDRLQEMDFGELMQDLVDMLRAMVDEAQEAKAF